VVPSSVRNRTCGGPEAARRRSTILCSHDPRKARLAANRSVTRAVGAPRRQPGPGVLDALLGVVPRQPLPSRLILTDVFMAQVEAHAAANADAAAA